MKQLKFGPIAHLSLESGARAAYQLMNERSKRAMLVEFGNGEPITMAVARGGKVEELRTLLACMHAPGADADATTDVSAVPGARRMIGKSRAIALEGAARTALRKMRKAGREHLFVEFPDTDSPFLVVYARGEQAELLRDACYQTGFVDLPEPAAA